MECVESKLRLTILQFQETLSSLHCVVYIYAAKLKQASCDQAILLITAVCLAEDVSQTSVDKGSLLKEGRRIDRVEPQ